MATNFESKANASYRSRISVSLLRNIYYTRENSYIFMGNDNYFLYIYIYNYITCIVLLSNLRSDLINISTEKTDEQSFKFLLKFVSG